MHTFLLKIRLKSRDIRHYLTTIQSLIRLLWQASPHFFLTSFVLTFLVGLLPLASIFITSTLLQMLVQATQPHSESTLPTRFILLIVLVTTVNFLSQMLQLLNAVVRGLHRTRVTNHVQLLIAEKAAEIDLACFEDTEFHNRMRISTNEATYRIPMFLDQLMMTSAMLTTFFSLAMVLLLWQTWIVLAIMVASLATCWVSVRFSSTRVNITTHRAETERKKFYINTLLTSDQAAKEIRLFGLGTFLLTTFRTLLETMFRQDRQFAIRELFYSGVAAIPSVLVQPALFTFIAFQALQGAISIGQFSLYTQSVIQMESIWTQLVSAQSRQHENNLFAAHLFDFLSLQSQVEASHLGLKTPIINLPKKPSIEFRNVSFCYPGTNQAAVSNMSFAINPGEAVALVGENGAGKTTLVKLLARLYQPTEGHILLDGVDIQTLERDELRAYLSLIFQDYTIYHLSARDNIGVGQVNWLNDFNRIKEAARRSGLDKVIEKLPNGYETVLGRFWQYGHELSGGQRQLVALARALLRDAAILILDEPSAALDIYTEQHFFQQLIEDRKAERLRTVIFISHRFTTVRRANRILVLERGRLVEQGTHEELIAQGGHYAEMFNLQAMPYKNSSQ